MEIGEETHKLAAFADDVLFYISRPRISLPNLLKVLKEYEELSTFKINLNKSGILNISSKEEYSLHQEFQFPWRKKGIKYLGIKLTASLGETYQANYIPLLDEVKAEVKRTLVLDWPDQCVKNDYITQNII